jgi:hypothetical protein
VRHGVLGLVELKRNLVTRLRHWDDGAKLISELAWRDFRHRAGLHRCFQPAIARQRLAA